MILHQFIHRLLARAGYRLRRIPVSSQEAVWFERKYLAITDRTEAPEFLRSRYKLPDLGSDLLGIESTAYESALVRARPWEPLFLARAASVFFRRKLLGTARRAHPCERGWWWRE